MINLYIRYILVKTKLFLAAKSIWNDDSKDEDDEEDDSCDDCNNYVATLLLFHGFEVLWLAVHAKEWDFLFVAPRTVIEAERLATATTLRPAAVGDIETAPMDFCTITKRLLIATLNNTGQVLWCPPPESSQLLLCRALLSWLWVFLIYHLFVVTLCLLDIVLGLRAFLQCLFFALRGEGGFNFLLNNLLVWWCFKVVDFHWCILFYGTKINRMFCHPVDHLDMGGIDERSLQWDLIVICFGWRHLPC